MIKFVAKKSLYITTAIDYANGVPHIGHAYEKVAADVQARWFGSLGYNVFFMTGTDEHGLKVQRAADAKGVTPEKFVNDISKEFKKAWKFLNLKYDRFIRTTDKDHINSVKKLILKVKESDDIYKDKYEGLYCVGCESFKTERDLINGKCPTHDKEPEFMSESSYFFKLSKYEKKLLDFYKKNPDFVQPKTRLNEIVRRVKDGLNDISITRSSFEWGVPFPLEKNYYTYVWFDALPNYITGIGWPSVKYKKIWNPTIHHIGKDILFFHAALWPAMLMSIGVEPPTKIFAHGYWTLESKKISKSLGNVVYPEELVKEYGADAVRYYLLREVPYGEDGDFSFKSLVTRYNTELANDLGNLVSRVLALLQKFSKGKIPGKQKYNQEDKDLIISSEKALRYSKERMEFLEFHHALDEIMKFVKAVNKYINDQKPWELAKTKDKKSGLDRVLYNSVESLRMISALLWPFMPGTCEKIAKSLGIKVPKLKNLEWGKLKSGAKVKKPEVLFPKVKFEEKKKEVFEDEDFAKLDLRIGKILKISDVKGAKKLHKLEVDLGRLGKRQLVAGLKEYYSGEDLEGKNITVVANLEPAKIKGVESEGMLLAAEDKKHVEVLHPEGELGERVFVKGIKSKPKKVLNIKEFMKAKLRVKDKKVVYGEKLLITKKGEIKTKKVKAGEVH